MKAIKNASPPPVHATWHSSALKIALIYVMVSGGWILVSDRLLYSLVRDPAAVELLGVAKGWFFVALTAVLLWALVQRMLVHIDRVQSDLRSSEEKSRTIYNGVNEGIFIFDPATGAIQDVNESASSMFSLSQQELCRKTIAELSVEENGFTQERGMEVLAEATKGRPVTVEWYARDGTGRKFWIEVKTKPAMIEGQPRVVVTLRDIDERKQASETVRKLLRAVEQSPISIVITDARGIIEYANPATSQLCGYSQEELLGCDPAMFKSENHTLEEYRRLWETILEGNEWRGQFLNHKKNGDFYWEESSISPITDESGKITHFLAVKEDISARKAAEAKLQHQEALLEEAEEIAHVGGWEFDPVTMQGAWSPEVSRIFDVPSGTTPNWELVRDLHQGESRDKIIAAVAASTQHGIPYDLELEIVSGMGHHKWVRSISRPVVNEGKVVLVRGSLQDITERKQAAQEIQESRANLRALLARIQETREEERTRIAREVHDVLGQLLTGMKMDLSWLERRLANIGDGDLRAAYTRKLAATNNLVDSMLECVQKISRDLRPSLLDNLGLPAALQAETRQFAERTGITCEISGLATARNLPGEAATQVFRIFQEVLTNIARHANATRVDIRMGGGPGEMTLCVQDNGRGMPAEALADPASFGLLGMTERAQLIGGSVEFTAAPQGGTRVRLTVPNPDA